MIQTIIFDLGGVLADWSPTYLYSKLIPDEKERQYFFDNVCTKAWNEEQDGGRSIAEANEILIRQFPKYKDEILAFYGRWEEMLVGSIDGTVAILEELKAKKQHRIYALTNWSNETFPIALRRFEWLQLFEGILVSGDEKLKKPDPKIYQLMLKRYEIDPTTAVFIDDSQLNVDASVRVGLPAIRFESPEKLRVDLMELGVFDG